MNKIPKNKKLKSMCKKNKSLWNSFYNYKLYILILICASLCYSILFANKKTFENVINILEINNHQGNKLIEENFFVFDSNNLNNVIPHMYGFSVSQKGILTDNYYKELGYYEIPEPQGTFVMIRKEENKLILNQDFHGSFGLYIYENKSINYFALSNSFLLLEEYLIGKQNISFNKDYADNLLISDLYSYSIYETLINEIIQLPSNVYIVIDLKKQTFNIVDIEYNENTFPLDSEEGIKIIDNWIDKWGYIFRSLKNKTEIISCDLSGGFDTRTVLSILLNSGVNLNEILIRSAANNKHVHMEDFKIASNISSKFGFKLNNRNFDNNSTIWNTNETLLCTIYSKLGFHKEFYLKNKFFNRPRFIFTGNGGEDLRGSPGLPMQKYIEKICSRNIFGHNREFNDSTKRLINRSVSLLKSKKQYNNDYEISYDLYSRIVGRNHFGRSTVEAFMANIYSLQPLMDPDIKKIKYDIIGDSPHDLLAFIYIRYAEDLIHFPIQGNRYLNLESIKKAKKLNQKLKPYKATLDSNNNFYIDIKRKSPVNNSKNNKTANDLLKEMFESPEYLVAINKIYDKEIYNVAKEYSKKSNYHPFRHQYALLAIFLTKKYLSLNKE